MQTQNLAIGAARLPAISAGIGVPVVFLHAGVCDHRQWLTQIEPVVAAGYRAVAYDRRGFGDATSPDEPFNHLDDLEAVLDALEIHAAVLVGCSMGGGLAVDFALKHPRRTVGLVLVGTAITGGDYVFSGNDEAVELALADAEERGDPQFQNLADAHAWFDGPRSQSGRVGGALRDLFYDMNGKALRKAPKLTQQTRPPSAHPRLGEITPPTLLIAGDLDFNYVLTRHDGLADDLPNAFGAIIEGTAHLPNMERPDLFNPLLLEFLASVASADELDP